MAYRSGKLAAVAVLLASLAACVQPRTTVNVVGDKFSKEVTLEGIPLHDPTNGVDLFWMLRSFVNPQARTASHQIYVEWTYAGQSSGRYHAADDTARPLPVTNLYKESCPFNKCPRTDTVGIGIDEATLRKRAATGFQVKLTGQDGYSGILDITSQMITAQLQAEDQALHAGSVSTAVAAANPEVVKGANEAATQFERFLDARYRITAAAANVCPRNRIQPSSGVNLLTLSALDSGTRGPILAAYPWLSDDVSIVYVARTSPAERAGLRAGDVLVSINGKSPGRAASGLDSAVKLIAASGTNPWRVAILRSGKRQEMTITPAKACGVILNLSKEETASIGTDGSLGAGLNAFIRSDDDEAAILAFALAEQIKPESDLNLDKASLTILAQAAYRVDNVPNLWRQLADAKAPVAAAHPVTEERLAAMRREITALVARNTQIRDKSVPGVAPVSLPFDPNAPGSNIAPTPQYSVTDKGIGITAIPMLGSKIKPGNLADGLMVAGVQKDSPAEGAGIKIGDIMTSFDGHSLANAARAMALYNNAAARAVKKGQSGKVIPVEIVRSGKRMKLAIHL